MECKSCGKSLVDSYGNSLEFKVDGYHFGVYSNCVALRCPHCGNERPVKDTEDAIRTLKQFQDNRTAAKLRLWD